MTERCARARRVAHSLLDGDAGPGALADLEAHLAVCPSCRELVADLEIVRAGLRELREHPLPCGALEEVLDRTVRASEGRRRAARWAAWATAAAAATILLALTWIRPGPPAAPVGGDLARARREAGIALSLAAGAIRETERAASDRVLAARVAPALRRVPVRWSALAASRKP